MQPQTHTYTDRARRVLVVAERDAVALDRAAMRHLTERVRGSHARVVAPADAVPGERWIIDLTARKAQARRRLEGWRAALEPHARAVETEIGDADARLALADAQHEFKPDIVLATTPPADPAPQPMRSARR